MIAEVVIEDTRKDWMVAEDRLIVCMTRCSQFRKCATRAGTDCKKFGGDVIPIIRDWRRGMRDG